MVFVSPQAGWINAAEQAAALRADGWRVILACSAPQSRGQRALLALDRLIYHEIWTGMTGSETDAQAEDALMDRILAPGTLDVRAFDYLGVQLARRKKQRLSGPALGLPDPEWYDKRVMADRLVAMGVPGPRVWDRPVAEEYPVIVKARITSAGKGVWICRDEGEVARAWLAAGGPDGNAFLQEMIHGPAFSTTGVAHDGELLAQETYVLTKPAWDPTGPSIRQEMVDRPDLVANTRTFIREVGYSGAFSFQQLEDHSGRGRPFDFNPRSPGSWIALRMAGSGIVEAYDSLLAARPSAAVDPLPPGTSSTTLMITGGDFESREQIRSWLRYTGVEIRKRKTAFGWRFGVWANVIRAKEYARATRQLRSRTRIS